MKDEVREALGYISPSGNMAEKYNGLTLRCMVEVKVTVATKRKTGDHDRVKD